MFRQHVNPLQEFGPTRSESLEPRDVVISSSATGEYWSDQVAFAGYYSKARTKPGRKPRSVSLLERPAACLVHTDGFLETVTPGEGEVLGSSLLITPLNQRLLKRAFKVLFPPNSNWVPEAKYRQCFPCVHRVSTVSISDSPHAHYRSANPWNVITPLYVPNFTKHAE